MRFLRSFPGFVRSLWTQAFRPPPAPAGTPIAATATPTSTDQPSVLDPYTNPWGIASYGVILLAGWYGFFTQWAKTDFAETLRDPLFLWVSVGILFLTFVVSAFRRRLTHWHMDTAVILATFLASVVGASLAIYAGRNEAPSDTVFTVGVFDFANIGADSADDAQKLKDRIVQSLREKLPASGKVVTKSIGRLPQGETPEEVQESVTKWGRRRGLHIAVWGKVRQDGANKVFVETSFSPVSLYGKSQAYALATFNPLDRLLLSATSEQETLAVVRRVRYAWAVAELLRENHQSAMRVSESGDSAIDLYLEGYAHNGLATARNEPRKNHLVKALESFTGAVANPSARQGVPVSTPVEVDAKYRVMTVSLMLAEEGLAENPHQVLGNAIRAGLAAHAKVDRSDGGLVSRICRRLGRAYFLSGIQGFVALDVSREMEEAYVIEAFQSAPSDSVDAGIAAYDLGKLKLRDLEVQSFSKKAGACRDATDAVERIRPFIGRHGDTNFVVSLLQAVGWTYATCASVMDRMDYHRTSLDAFEQAASYCNRIPAVQCAELRFRAGLASKNWGERRKNLLERSTEFERAISELKEAARLGQFHSPIHYAKAKLGLAAVDAARAPLSSGLDQELFLKSALSHLSEGFDSAVEPTTQLQYLELRAWCHRQLAFHGEDGAAVTRQLELAKADERIAATIKLKLRTAPRKILAYEELTVYPNP